MFLHDLICFKTCHRLENLLIHLSEQQFLNELEKRLWTSADKLRGSLDAANYKHVVLGLVFLKYISDRFDARREEILTKCQDPNDEDHYLDKESLGDRYEWALNQYVNGKSYYNESNVFWVPEMARWAFIKDHIRTAPGERLLPTGAPADAEPYVMGSSGRLIDDAMAAIEKENEKLKGILNTSAPPYLMKATRKPWLK